MVSCAAIKVCDNTFLVLHLHYNIKLATAKPGASLKSIAIRIISTLNS